MRTIKFYFMILAVFLTAGFVTRAASVVDVIVNSPNHNTLETAVVTAGLVPALQGTGPFTVFAPTDDAFAALPAGTLSALLSDIPALTDVLLYHVADGKVLSSDLNGVQTIKSLSGKNATVVVNNGSVYINNAKVTVADIVADNGVVHVIDAVLLPPASLPKTVVDIIGNSPDHVNLSFALSVAGLDDDLQAVGPFTVFAPTNAAFKAIPKEVLDALFVNSAELKKILLNHVVSAKAMSSNLSNGQKIKTLFGKDVTVSITAEGVFVNNAKVSVTDLEAENGVVHVIDAVMTPAADVKIVESASKGKIITDANGRTLYFFSRDVNGNSLCTGGCLNNWPVFYAENLVTGDGLNPADFGSIDRGSGVMQTTYKGWPLYYYVNDNQSGNMNGDGLIGKWFVAKPDYSVMIVDNQLTGLNGVNYKGDYTPGDEIIQYFVDDKGRTLFTWKNDKFNTNKFTKSDFSNNGVWPIYEESDVMIPSVLNKSDFGVINVFGKDQLTYKGWPLYYFGQDMMVRGNTKGVSVPSPGTWPVPVKDMKSPKHSTVVDIVVNSENHTTLEAAVVAAGLVETLQGAGPFTVFAPTDAAFAALPAGTVEALLADIPALTNILTYHVAGAKAMSSSLTNGQKVVTVQGKPVTVTINENGVFINNAKVTVADIEADNGVVHVIDAVLIPSSLPSTVVDIVVNSENHTTLEAAVVAAGLVETLQGAGPFTVFAPTDAAFAALPAGTVEALLADIPALTNILTYHVAGAKAMSSSLTNGQKVVTVQGKPVTVTINENGVFINNAKVTVADIEADNGVVHVIDAVLIPSSLPSTVVDIVVNSENHTTLEAAVVAAGLVETLQGAGPFTVFAPTDAAFAALPAGTVEALLADIPALTNILTYHVAGAKAMSTDLSNGQKVVTVQGKPVTVTINENGVFINNAKVTVADIEADNGVVHVIDAVLIPSSLPSTVVDIVVNSENHTTLEAAVVAAGLVETLQGAGPFTVFAPTDAAFAALPAGTVEALLADIPALTNILTYHVAGAKAMSTDLSNGQKVVTVQGKPVTVTINENGVFINNAKVTVADIEADNGVVHVIDAVLIPSSLPSTVVDIVVNSENHTTLEAAVVAAGLVETLQGAGPFTVFAPTDAAFAALPAGTVEALLADIPALTNILTYHVANAKAMSTDLSNGQKVITVQGKEVTVTINENGVFINNAKVTVADIKADNGVVHVIDAVLLPPVDKAAFPINFETETDAVWNVFANGAGSADDFMVISNPDKSGNNTSDKVLKFKVNDGADPWAGAFSDSYAPFEITATSNTVTMMVWKSVISPVGFKLEASTNGGPVTEVKVSNTVTNQWEKITFDLSSLAGYSYNRIVIFPDFPSSRTSGTTVYIDNIEKEETVLPSTVVDIVVNSADHTTLEAAVVAAGLVETLQGAGPFTVFAPTDAAFAALPAGTIEALLADIPALTNILTYHVAGAKAMSTDLSNGQKVITVQGKPVTVTINENGVFINNAKVTVADIEAENGVVHVIDAVLIPSSLPSTVVDIVVNSENHTTLEAAVVAAGLVETLQGDGPFTVFAPTDAAFFALPAGTVEALLADIPALTNILTYHVAGAKAMSTDLSNGQKVVTVQGTEITVTINENGVFINNAKVTVADIEADNGVVHVIDAVLLPTTGIDSELDEISFDIYPNPASDYIRINSNAGIESLIIRDVAGRIITQKKNLKASERVELNGYKTGIYLVTMKNGNSVSTKKLIVR